MNPSLFDPLFKFSVVNRSRIISYFKILYFFLFLFLLIGGYSIYTVNKQYITFYSWGITWGRTAILLYIVTTIPGITKRFGFQHRLIQIIMLFRRYIGITVFTLGFTHYMFMRGIGVFFKGTLDVIPALWFERFASIALLLLLCMFLTSNDISTKKLGTWWGRIHTVTYIIVWLLFLHTFLQRVSIYSVLIGITAVLQVFSHIFAYQRTRKAAAAVSESGASKG